MYEDLINKLRELPHLLFVQLGEHKDAVYQAADAIEELDMKLHGANAAIAGMQREIERMVIDSANSKPQWIPVTERLPEDEESVLVVRKFLGIEGQVPPSTYTEIAYKIGDRWVADSDEYKVSIIMHTDPLYWMPIPEPPKEAEP